MTQVRRDFFQDVDSTMESKQPSFGRPAVATIRGIVFLLAVAMSVALAGCGGESTAHVQNPTLPPQSNVAIAFQPEPAGALAVSFTENLTAVVTNDPNHYGVDWSLVCPSSIGAGNCGALATLHTASGAPNSYIAPSTISTDSMAVEIIAYATASPSANVVAPVTVTTFNGSLVAGTYILQAQGADSGLNPYEIAAALVLDGNGNIKSGEQVANYISGSLIDSNLTGNYFLGSDGRGTITLNTNDTTIGQNGVETFAFVYLSHSESMISQMDFGSAATGASATGTLNLQTSTTAPTGGYAFVASGTDVVISAPVAFGGVLNIDSTNAISGNGSVTDEIVSRRVKASGLGLSGTLTPPDPFGAITLNLTAPFGTANKPIAVQLMGFIVDSSHIQLIETDDSTSGTVPFGLTAGVAIGQGTATGSFTGNASLSGTYVFGVAGVDLSNLNLVPWTMTAAGLFTADGAGNLNNGFTDTFLALNTIQGTSVSPQTGAQISLPFTGTYSVDATGTGRASSTSITFNPEPKRGYDPVLFFYLTGNGNPPLVLQSGDIHYPSIGAGIAYPQSTETPAFSGDYGIRFTQELSAFSENDATAPLNANSKAATLSGFADINLDFGATLDQAFTGTFAAPTATAPFSGSLAGTNNGSVSSVAFTPPIAVDYYFIDPGHGFFVETDLVNSVPPATPPTPSGQVSFGYYAARTPLCTGCP
jgi:hypothetical protein